MTKMIAVCEFEKNERSYEYLCDIPAGYVPEDLKYAVTLDAACADDADILKTKRLISRLQVVFIRSFKPLTDQTRVGELNRVVLVFGMNEFVEHAVRRQKMHTLRANLERRLAEMTIFEKIKALGVTDREITSMAEELQKLMTDK